MRTVVAWFAMPEMGAERWKGRDGRDGSGRLIGNVVVMLVFRVLEKRIRREMTDY